MRELVAFVFWDWLNSLSIFFSSSIYLPTHSMISFLLQFSSIRLYIFSFSTCQLIDIYYASISQLLSVDSN